MTDTNTKVRSLILTALMVVSVFGGSIAFAGSAAAAGNLTAGGQYGSLSSAAAVSNTQVAEGQTVNNFQTTFSADELAFDGGTDTMYVQFPNALESSLSLNSVTMTTQNNAGGNPIATSNNIVDGPDNDGVMDTVKVTEGVDSSTAGANPNSFSLQVDVSFTAPSVSSDTSYGISASVEDSSGSNIPMTQYTSFTVNNDATTDNTQLSSGSTAFQGQTLYYTSNVAANEVLEVRHSTSGSSGPVPGQLETQVTANNNGQVIIDTSDLPADSYFLVDPDTAGDGDGSSGEGSGSATSFEVVVQNLDVTADPTTVDNDASDGGASTTLAINSNRAGSFDHIVTSSQLTDAQLAAALGTTDDDTDNDGTVTGDGVTITAGQSATPTVNFDGLDAGNYTLNFDVTDTTAEDSATVTVTDQGEGQASFENAVVSEDRGDVAEFTIDLQDTTTATVVVGSDSVNYEAAAEVTDVDEDGEVTVQFNSYATQDSVAATFSAAGEDDTAVPTAVPNDNTGDATDATGTTSSPLADAEYGVSVFIGSDEQDVASLVINERSSTGLTMHTASGNGFGVTSGLEAPTDVYGAIEDGTITQDNTIAAGDVAIHQVQVTGIYGALASVSDSQKFTTTDGTTGGSASTQQLTADTPEKKLAYLIQSGSDGADSDSTYDSDEAPINLNVVQAGSSPNADPKRLSVVDTFENDALDVIVDSQNKTVFVNVLTSDAEFVRSATPLTPGAEYDGSLVAGATGEEFDATFSVNPASGLVEESDSVTGTFELTRRTASIDTNDDNMVEVSPETEQTISGDTSIASGSQVTIRARASGDNPFLKSQTTTVSADGQYSASFDFSGSNADTEFTVRVTSRYGSFANAASSGAVEADGIVANATDTPTPEPDTPTPEPDTPTPEPTTDTPEPTTDTPTDGGDGATETDGSQPGFGGAVAIIALAGAALIALRRGN